MSEQAKPKGSYTITVEIDDEGKDVAEIVLNPLTRTQFGQMWRLVQKGQEFMAGEYILKSCWHSGDKRLEKAKDAELNGDSAIEAAYRIACIQAKEIVEVKNVSIKKN